MKIDIKCVSCAEILSGKEMIKQTLKQTKGQMTNWKVLVGIKKAKWIPTCNSCGKEGEGNFCCPKCGSKEIWEADVLKSGNLYHKC
tara:strand:+ start:347 stop:604 length:258 start_codon:yes stop_codon:yes gene_type:complete